MMIIDNKFALGQMVYLKTDSQQSERLITGICVAMTGSVTYRLGCGGSESWHYELEICEHKDILKSTTE